MSQVELRTGVRDPGAYRAVKAAKGRGAWEEGVASKDWKGFHSEILFDRKMRQGLMRGSTAQDSGYPKGLL